jgi:two-component system OmpR family sensor kinase
VEQLLLLARQEPETLEQSWDEVNLAALVQEAVQQNRPLAENRNTAIVLTLPDKVTVLGQSAHLLTMVGNLVNNAVIYTPLGGQVSVKLNERHDHIQLDIADNGIGIALEDRERVFDRFFRVINSKEKGSGLGLSIVKAIADRHGIDISVHSAPTASGTLFRLIFPKKQAS